MPEWGTPNLKIQKNISSYNDIGWALYNYLTPIMFRNNNGEVFFDTSKYSNTTTTIQNKIRSALANSGVGATEVDPAGMSNAVDSAIDAVPAPESEGDQVSSGLTADKGSGKTTILSNTGTVTSGAGDTKLVVSSSGESVAVASGTTTGSTQSDADVKVTVTDSSKKTSIKKISEVMMGEQVGIADEATGESKMLTVEEQATDPQGATSYIATDEAGAKVVIPEGTDVTVNTDTLASTDTGILETIRKLVGKKTIAESTDK